ncbi:hypothetical protein [Actinoplanes sp. NBRC 103695]|uniref:hypothetical protein n=1 Tax=Actinoplanes sp. NBRC 103695 TaxID=3032202 RepID=UPI0025553A7E|nr:hypothetical protein [Actinoplanes sp. NBRC 103695]
MTSPNTNTNLDPVVATRVAGDHRETAANVGREQANFSTAVDLMDDQCSGAMLRAVLDARDAWTEQLNRIIGDLNGMADNVDGSVQDIDLSDQQNAGAIGNIGADILRDI